MAKENNYKLGFAFRNYVKATRNDDPFEIQRIKVAGYMNLYEFIQLFNEGEGYYTKTYSFNTKIGESLFDKREIAYEMDEKVYGNRHLKTNIKLSSYLDDGASVKVETT